MTFILPLVTKQGSKFIRSATEDCYDHHAKEIGVMIPEKDRNFVFAWNIPSQFYLETNLYPCIKYCDWQEHYIKIYPDIKEELQNIFVHEPPLWIVTKSNAENAVFFSSILENQYMLYFENEKYILWKIREANYGM